MKDSCPFIHDNRMLAECAFYCCAMTDKEYALWKKIIVYRGFPERVF